MGHLIDWSKLKPAKKRANMVTLYVYSNAVIILLNYVYSFGMLIDGNFLLN